MSSKHSGSLAMTAYQAQTLTVINAISAAPPTFITGHSQALLNPRMLGSLPGQPHFREDGLCTQMRREERGWAPGSNFSHYPVSLMCKLLNNIYFLFPLLSSCIK